MTLVNLSTIKGDNESIDEMKMGEFLKNIN
ncbi:hypothetical protein CDFC105_104131 [Clostridioides difficile]|nr:hypothetical protein CDFC105_104131 [Clostridioides difficile]